MKVLELRDKIITNGIASLKTHEKRPERLKGGIAGFELCLQLKTPDQYEETLRERYRTERAMINKCSFHGEAKTDDQETELIPYREYRAGTVQVEFVWERLKIAWKIGDTFSARAAIHVNDLLKES
jgi:hypothetical protein